jgi:predicted TIM-barrel fold metal-dependent hydrolase
MQVLENAIALGLRGVCVLASIDGRTIATEETLPVFKRIDEAGLTIFLHPSYRSSTADRAVDFSVEGGLGWMYQTTVAALSLITSGTLDACPNLRVVHPHVGGTLPFIRGRVDRLPLGAGASRLDHYLKKNFYVDTCSFTPGALRLAIDAYGIDRVLFGSDFPLWPIERCIAYVETNADPDEVAAIMQNRPEGFDLS